MNHAFVTIELVVLRKNGSGLSMHCSVITDSSYRAECAVSLPNYHIISFNEVGLCSDCHYHSPINLLMQVFCWIEFLLTLSSRQKKTEKCCAHYHPYCCPIDVLRFDQHFVDLVLNGNCSQEPSPKTSQHL